MKKPVKFSVALYLVNPQNENEFLIVKRPSDDDSLPNVWGLPAVTVKDDELPEAAAKRVGSEKLVTEISPTGFIGIKSVDRGSYMFILMDIKGKLIGNTPNVLKSTTTSTKYVDQKWTSDLNLLKEAASKGSLCSQVVLDKNNIEY